MPNVKENGQESIPTNSNKKSVKDYAICSKTLLKEILKVLIGDQETYKIKGRNKSDHNTFIIDIEKTINNNKMHPKYSWKINNNTNWNTCKNAIENKIEYNPPANYQDLEQALYSAAMRTIGMYKFNSNQVHNNKNIITARQQKHTAKKNYNKQSKQKVLAHKEEVQSSGSSLYKTKMNLF